MAPAVVAVRELCYKGSRYDGYGNMISCNTWDDWSRGRRIGLIVGIILGVIVVTWFCWCCCCRCGRARWAKVREKPRPMLLSELRAQQQRARENRGVSRARGSGAAESEQETHAHIAVRNNAELEEEREVVKPPPAYHEVVNDQERMLATHAIGRHDDVPAASYLPPVGSAREPPTTTPTAPLPYFSSPQAR